MSRNSHFFDGLFFGTIIGLVIGFLFAPQTGEETRNQLMHLKTKDEESQEDQEDDEDKAPETTEKMISKTLEAIEQGFDKISNIVDKNQKTSSKSES